MNNEGIVLDPEIDEVLDSEHDPNNPANRDYFANAANEDNINRLLAGAQLGKQNYIFISHLRDMSLCLDSIKVISNY